MGPFHSAGEWQGRDLNWAGPAPKSCLALMAEGGKRLQPHVMPQTFEEGSFYLGWYRKVQIWILSRHQARSCDIRGKGALGP